MRIDDLFEPYQNFRSQIDLIKQNSQHTVPWYPYYTLENIRHINSILSEQYQELDSIIQSRPILDIGCADGDLGYFMESFGDSIDFVDYAATNYNSLRGLHTLKSALHSSADTTNPSRKGAMTFKKLSGLAFILR